LNCQGFLDGCRLLQFPVLKYVLEMEGDVLLVGGEEVGHLRLGEPDGIFIRAELDAALAVWGAADAAATAGAGASFSNAGRLLH
jgi:hypothetical protein